MWSPLSSASKTEAKLNVITAAADGSGTLLKPTPLLCWTMPGEEHHSHVGKLMVAHWENDKSTSEQKHYCLSVHVEKFGGGMADMAGAIAVGIPYTVPKSTQFEAGSPVFDAGKMSSLRDAGGWDSSMNVRLPDYADIGTLLGGSNANAAFGYNCLATGGFSFSTG